MMCVRGDDPGGVCLPLWPLCYYSATNGEVSSKTKWLPFIFTFARQRSDYALLSSSEPPPTSFFFSILVILLRFTKDHERVCLDLLFPLFRFEFSRKETNDPDASYHTYIHSGNYSIPDPASLPWALDFRLLPLLVGHIARNRVSILALAPVPLWISFTRRACNAPAGGDVPLTEVQVHAVPFISFIYTWKPSNSTTFFTLFYVLYYHTRRQQQTANQTSTYRSFVIFPLVWVFHWDNFFLISLFTVFWFGKKESSVALLVFPVIVFSRSERSINLMLFLVVWFRYAHDKWCHFMLFFLVWCRFKIHDHFYLFIVPLIVLRLDTLNVSSALMFRFWVPPFIMIERMDYNRWWVCIAPLFYARKEDTPYQRSLLWSALMLVWYSSSFQTLSGKTQKWLFVPPVFFFSSDLCPSVLS